MYQTVKCKKHIQEVVIIIGIVNTVINGMSRNTLLAWMVYLNDVDDGGETEFLYQSKRLSPKRNQFVIWTLQDLHTYIEANPPLSGVKYVVTGWIDWI